VNSTVDHKIGRVPPDPSVIDDSKDLCVRGLAVAALSISFCLFALEQRPPSIISFDVSDEVM
jgi:hypothetical protein